MNYFFPDIYQKSIYKINYDKLKDNGIKCLLFDLDNTCVPYVDKKPTKKLLSPTEEVLKYFLKRGIGHEVVEKYVSAATK